MDKYIAFGLYRKNEQGGHQEISKPREGEHVYLASDVDALLKALREIVEDHAASHDGTVRLSLIEAARDLMVSDTK